MVGKMTHNDKPPWAVRYYLEARAPTTEGDRYVDGRGRVWREALPFEQAQGTGEELRQWGAK